YGRRRVGKTFLITEFFKEKGFFFELSGQHKASHSQQLGNFASAVTAAFGVPIEKPRTWNDAFEQLKQQLIRKELKGRIVIFFDELPWLVTRKSGFLGSLEYFWNTWASRSSQYIIIVCGSAASWVVRNIVNATGGLHNRLTASIRLLPFSLSETRKFLHHRGIHLNDRQILEIYMITGGIPHYLKHIRKGLSAAQNINDLCFKKDGFLTNEFDRLFDSLFENSLYYKKIVIALTQSKYGLGRPDLLKVIGVSPGGTLNRVLANLEEAGFILRLKPFGKVNRESVFRLCDEYSRFYMSFIEKINKSITDDANSEYWQKVSIGQRWKIWAGLAFEDVIFKHIHAVKKALGISGVITNESSWHYKADAQQEGVQIDLVIDRNDNCITLCEIKHHDGEIVIDKKTAEALQRKVLLFKEQTGTSKTVFLSMITVYGIRRNDYVIGLIDNQITLIDLLS
ncbi:MAG: hypothetical protein JW795_03810, partial [Chitinivibrionales bacterium]|nr:hypothetical protein [Chitinivibrionales bacterium]